ncbi:Capsular polysaccharide biosynthesis protein [Paenibacillus sp. UNC496MF]|uniref:YveK family protein n=1 Tax=Paenibacillus sp. UNC496MF TaxID=1502753 RepID=UPI0008EC783E|nr:Wzz/FepE/Etk N-terminal domain-containing protein [Paenibacillus sp. UNC496MF]SFI88383.1 Capsular polysaccharide biosynthesis protein [Paenibacillus sp. UNC496MF]
MELKRYMMILRKKMWLISAIVVVICALTGVKSFFYTDSVYKASAKLIVSQSFNVEGTQMLDWTNIQSNIMLISSYKEIINSSAILDKVVSKYPDLKITPNELGAQLTVSAASDSQVMNIDATDTSYPRAVKIVNAVSEVFKNEIPSIMKIDNVTILSKANLKDEAGPINTSPIITVILSFIVSLFLGIGIVFLLDYLDDTIKTEDDVLGTLDLPMLTYISKINKSDLSPRRMRAKNKQVGEGAYATVEH